MVRMEPRIYQKYIAIDKNGKQILYALLCKALYGLLESALLCYKKFLRDLLNQGFKLNPYDPRVAYKTVDGTQMTVTWHIEGIMQEQ